MHFLAWFFINYKTRMSSLTVCISILSVLLACVPNCKTQETDCPSDWFGESCQFQCHCRDTRACNKTMGCPGTLCKKGWFGPACQYLDLVTRGSTSSFLGWLKDSNDTTCNSGLSVQQVNVTFSVPLLFTWLRLVVKNAASMSFEIMFMERIGNSQPIECPSEESSKVSDTTVDIHCKLDKPVQQILVSGDGVGSLCSLYVSGGRNVALKQQTAQTGTYNKNLTQSENAVDGNTSPKYEDGSCTHTTSQANPRWTVNFTRPMRIFRYVLYNRNSNQELLKDFLLQSFADNGTRVLNYTEPGETEDVYTVVPAQSSMTSPISSVSVTATKARIMTICEAEMFGDVVCDSTHYGRECENSCNCLHGRPCFVSTGGCPSGCAAGYFGESCGIKCSPGKYGPGCNKTCSKNCHGDSVCDFRNGTCPTGCIDGYHGPQCDQKCSSGTYGLECKGTCSGNCAENATCDFRNGACPAGCEDGFLEFKCDKQCSPGNYGFECYGTCSGNCADKKTCDFRNGTCPVGCEDGYRGENCDTACPAGQYGSVCSGQCSPTCGGDGRCNVKDGTCTDGCQDGYLGQHCTQRCPAGTYGRDCNSTCSPFCLSLNDNSTDSSCHHIFGKCHRGCQTGYTGDLCQSEDKVGDKEDDVPVAAIAAPLAILVVLAVLVVVGVFMWRRRKHNNQDDVITGLENSSNKSGDISPYNEVPTPPKAEQIQPEERNESIYDEIAETSAQYSIIEMVDYPQTKYENIGSAMKKNKPSETRGIFPAFVGEFALTGPIRERLSVGGTASTKMYYNTVSLPNTTSMAVQDLKSFMLSHSREFFRQQFKVIPENKNATIEVVKNDGEGSNNHLQEIYPYAHARVHLLENEEQKQSDYINASYVQGYKREEIFIASPDPRKTTLQDFIRMIWEQSVEQVVMLSGLEDRTFVKCERYWPEEGEMDVGEIKVRLTTTQVFADYTIRRLQLCKAGNRLRVLTQFHFISWSQDDVPLIPWSFVDFQHRMISYPTTKPILVHCSSGVGRTGTFIALRNVMREAEDTGRVDFFTTVQRLRVDRMNMVQTAEQYQFVHNAALAASVCMGTIVTATEVQRRLEILEHSQNTGHTKLEMEFAELCQVCDIFQPGTQSQTVRDNKHKKAAGDQSTCKHLLSPGDLRVKVAPEHQDSEGVHAVFKPSFACNDQQIVTNLPSPSTVDDFWRLVTQSKVSLIVAFDEDPTIDRSIGEYLPKNDNKKANFSLFDIEAGPITHGRLTETRQIFITSNTKTNSQTSPYGNVAGPVCVTHIRCQLFNLDPTKCLALANEIRSHKSVPDGRILHMCRNGAVYSDLMCVVLLLLDRMEHDHRLTVPLVVGTVNTLRPQAVSSLDQYRLLYEILRI